MCGTIYSLSGPAPEEVREDTWGHLRPDPQREHNGYVDCYYSHYGGSYGILDLGFDDLEDSPWLFGVASEFVEALIDEGLLCAGEVRRVYFIFSIDLEDEYTVRINPDKTSELASFSPQDLTLAVN